MFDFVDVINEKSFCGWSDWEFQFMTIGIVWLATESWVVRVVCTIRNTGKYEVGLFHQHINNNVFILWLHSQGALSSVMEGI